MRPIGDCNDRDATVHPGATEVANGRDDNGNGQSDEAAAPANPANSSAPLGIAAPADESCAFAPAAHLRGLPLFVTGLVLGWARMRRAGRRQRREV
jgi:Putative metal-binding motif